MSVRLFVTISGLIALLAAIVLVTGCKEKEVGYVIDEEEIAAYIAQTEIGRDLFRADNLIVTSSFTTPFDGVLYLDSVMSHSTTMTVHVSDSAVDYDALGFLREAVAVVEDRFSMRTYRIDGIDTIVTNHVRGLSRSGFFLKLGNDSQDFVGWLLWGFRAGIGPVIVDAKVSTGENFRADDLYEDLLFRNSSLDTLGYARLTKMPLLKDASQMIVETTIRNAAASLRYFQLISGTDQDSLFTRPMTRIDAEHYVDTISIGGNPRLYDLILIQSFNEATGAPYKSWVFPYKLQ